MPDGQQALYVEQNKSKNSRGDFLRRQALLKFIENSWNVHMSEHDFGRTKTSTFAADVRHKSTRSKQFKTIKKKHD